MGDFLLDLRSPNDRSPTPAAELLGSHSRARFHAIDGPGFRLTVGVAGNDAVWAPYIRPDGSGGVAVAGRIVVEDSDRESTKHLAGPGGWVCKAIDGMLARPSSPGPENLGGNFVVFAWDVPSRRLRVWTDCTGVFPAYETELGGRVVLGSHPDSLARATGETSRRDEVSIAEFLLTGTVSPPYTYYERIRAVGRAMVLTFDLRPQEGPVLLERRCYLPIAFRGVETDREDEVAEEFAAAFRKSVALRSRPGLGRCAIALSGGLDSRAVLASLHPEADAFAFTCYDAPNLEYRTAKAIADAVGTRFLPFRRPFEYYGDHAAEGVRIAGGMGSFANNHFLGVLPWLGEQGAETLLTGCYCDYLFKGLPLNRRTDRLTGHEELGPFDAEFYFSHVWPDTPLARQVRDRIQGRYPESVRRGTDYETILQLEALRTFPLCYEGDNAQRLVPQRLTGWFPPISDPELMRLYCRMPYPWKLNRSIFRKAVRLIAGNRFDAIPDANTGARMQASSWSLAINNLLLYAKRRLRRWRSGLATEGSWPDWRYYAAKSTSLRRLWDRPAPEAEAMSRRVLGSTYPEAAFGQGTEPQMWLQIQILTLRIWWPPNP